MPDRPKLVPAEMSALRVHAFGQAPRLDRVPVPEPGPEDVLVEIAAGVVSHHDVTVAGGDFPVRPELPYVPGLEGAGRVVAAGREVDSDRVSVGMRVRVLGGGLGATRSGTWGEYAAVTAKAATPVPEDVDLALAAAFGSVAAAAWAALLEVGELRSGERVGVTGASGAVGSLVAQLAVLHGAGSVVAWTRSLKSAEACLQQTVAKLGALALGVGVEAKADPPEDAETSLQRSVARPAPRLESVEIVGPDERVKPVDLLVDTVGGPDLGRRVEAVRPGGRVVLVGYTAGTEVELSLPRLMAADVALLPLNMMRHRIPRDVEAGLLADAAAGRLRLPVETVAPEDVADAIERLVTGATSGRLVVAW